MKPKNWIKDIFEIIRDLILTPVVFWANQNDKKISLWQLFTNYYFPLVLVVSLAVFIGAWIGSTHFYIGFAVLKAIRELLLFTILYFSCIYIVNLLLNSFEGEKNPEAVFKLVTFSLVPFLITSFITGLFPGLYIVNVAGLYSAYIFWVGAKKLLIIPERKQSGFILISILLCLFVFSFLSIIFWKIFVAFY